MGLRACRYRASGIRLDPSLASALRTSDWDKPNCRAIWDGLTPALKAARTAFIFPGVKMKSGRFDLRLVRGSVDADGFLPRRFCSASAAASNRSTS
jgi:hypothetical protein